MALSFEGQLKKSTFLGGKSNTI